MNIHFTTPKPGEMEMIAAAGCKWVRMDISWDAIEKQKGKYDFGAYDTLIAALDRSNSTRCWCSTMAIKLYSSPADSHPYATQEFRDAYARWAVATVTHFRARGSYGKSGTSRICRRSGNRSRR